MWKQYIPLFLAGTVAGISVPYFFGTISRWGKPKVNDNKKKKEEEKPQNENVDPRFDFPRPTYNYTGEYKLVLGVRMDIEHSLPDMASLIGDMAIKSVVNAMQFKKDDVLQWLHFGQAKITTKVPDAAKMAELIQKCKDANVPFAVIEKDGQSVIIGIGPGPIEPITKVSGDLKLI
ncbi:hypothetical protein TVAG_172530 [Trichomonas vaginalis G3]|uniref:peptidyl-tRNA hydrolase n=1 Tax=Trichomonas vaginalis (strain ATCC PRA-98 / G3) TaxID=412133 RepID=A2DF04_TRIV3|nr:aminoacyl-tRNA hydrolase protein [Trichomonas vaginalis G3]EAY20996.1 hypothetical protein TVAG_172530 [Trichomonas vaginalis G3]KAI5519167.1 aminoacyl-tRNA hydrolase protein [Trichomonas vaginalis G3]|eukprot:XP_001581982.1 hypothetical protein [Trichomonas vaginalis G3]